METPHQAAGILVLALHALIIIALAIRVIMRRLPTGASLAWLILIVVLPFAGALAYLILGERHLGRRRAKRAARLFDRKVALRRRVPPENLVDPATLPLPAGGIFRLAAAAVDVPPLSDNRLDLLENADDIFRALIADMDQARHSLELEFYIWSEGGRADAVAEALMRAAGRGVKCRVLLDAVGSAPFLKNHLTRRLKASGIQVVGALPVGAVRMWFVRVDLRNHRKIALIDRRIAYTGSFNLVDPRFFKQDAGVGQWVDAMARLEGPAVTMLAALFDSDWELETGEAAGPDVAPQLTPVKPRAGSALTQVVPSGPGSRDEAIHQVLLMGIYAAERELVMTTPYFVPDEALLKALCAAALRGVAVTLILPARVDSRLVRYASRSYFGDLLRAGVRILNFQGGLLHTKSLTLDGATALFGTVNLDNRSFWLDFEVSLLVHDRAFGQRLRALQARYAQDAVAIEPRAWQSRPTWQRFVENAAQLFGPLL